MNRKEYSTVVALALVAGLAGGLFAGRFLADEPAIAQQRNKVVNSEEFLLVDRFGKTRAGLGLDSKTGEVGLILLNKDGTRNLYLTPDDNKVLQLKDKEGRVLWSAP
jgi:hypothetical protein